jgi:hypothetical protein
LGVRDRLTRRITWSSSGETLDSVRNKGQGKIVVVWAEDSKLHRLKIQGGSGIEWTKQNSGHAVRQVVEALRYKPEGRGFDSLWSLKLKCFIDVILLAAQWPWVRI